MRKILIALSFLTLAGCSSISFYDDNESEAAIDLLVDVDNINCVSPNVKDQVSVVRDSLDWLTTYSSLKGSGDITAMLTLMDKTVTGMEGKETITVTYCKLKKTVMKKQSSDIARAVMGRY